MVQIIKLNNNPSEEFNKITPYYDRAMNTTRASTIAMGNEPERIQNNEMPSKEPGHEVLSTLHRVIRCKPELITGQGCHNISPQTETTVPYRDNYQTSVKPLGNGRTSKAQGPQQASKSQYFPKWEIQE